METAYTASSSLRLDASWVDYALVALFFVFVLGIGVLLLGVVIMIIQSMRHPDFFRGRTLKQGVHAE